MGYDPIYQLNTSTILSKMYFMESFFFIQTFYTFNCTNLHKFMAMDYQ